MENTNKMTRCIYFYPRHQEVKHICINVAV